MKIKLKELCGKIVCKSGDNRIRDEDGKYPRINWVHDTGFRMNRGNVRYQYVDIDASPHYRFVNGERSDYIEYMCTKGWKSGYGKKRIRAEETFAALMDTFDEYNPSVKYIEVVEERGRYAIVDGLHRSSILFARDSDMEVEVKVIRCRPFTGLPMLNE